MNQLHYIQLAILKKLLFSEGLKFSELKPFDYIENNKLDFHLDKIIAAGFVIKDKDLYKLTSSGKEYANRMTTEKTQIKLQGKIGCIQCCIKTTGLEPEFLIYTRLKHPFYGSQGYASGKVDYGEKTVECSQRELKEETNLEGKGELFMIEHHIVYDKNSHELLEDKYFYFHRYINPKGKLICNNEGLFEWVKESALEKYFVKPFESVERLMKITARIKDIDHPLTYEEHEHYADNF